MNTITVGQQHYRWQVQVFSWLKMAECTIYNIIDPPTQLSIVLLSKYEKRCTPKHIEGWISTALQQGWYNEQRSYRLVERQHKFHLLPIPNGLQEEKELIAKIAQQYPNLNPPTALQRSNITYQWEQLEKKLGFDLPTALQQLYAHLGNGNFGPDYGFFLLESDVNTDKITLLEAYQELQAANMVDWDWQLPKEALPFLYWGSDIYSIIDASNSNYPVYILDMNLKKTNTTWQACYWMHCSSFFEWLNKWAVDEQSGRGLWLEMYQLRGLL